MALASPGLQTGFNIYPAIWNISSSGPRSKTFRANVERIGIVFSLLTPAQGSINASSGEYTAPGSVAAPVLDTVVGTAPDGSVATSIVSLIL
jgi:hypothetical protein